MIDFTKELETLENSLLDGERPAEGFYAKQLNRKSEWQPAKMEKQPETDTTIARCIALALCLEVPVGEYALEASRREFTPEQRYVLIDNAKDEITHYNGFLNYHLNNPISEQFLMEAAQFKDVLDDIKEHPIVKAGYIELGVFFPVLSILRQRGTAPLKLLSAYISRDESSHVAVNWKLIGDNGLTPTLNALNDLRKDVIHWLTQETDSTFWMNQSDQLMRQQSAAGLNFTRAAMVTAFFEVSNRSMGTY